MRKGGTSNLTYVSGASSVGGLAWLEGEKRQEE